jgi:chromosome segregation ATPase
MNKTTFLLISIAVCLMTSCGNEKLQIKIAELEAELDSSKNTTEQLSTQFQKVDLLIDSITRSESYIAFNLETGTSFQDHVDRLRGLSAFIEYTRQKMIKLEQRMADETNENTALHMLIGKMRKELENKDKIITRLRKQVNEYEAENEELIKLVDLQQKEIIDIEQQLKIRMTALDKAEQNIEELKSEKEKILANAFYEKAIAVEEIANRTNFAPQKKKEAYEEALNLYKMAFNAGRKDAQQKITALEKEL